MRQFSSGACLQPATITTAAFEKEVTFTLAANEKTEPLVSRETGVSADLRAQAAGLMTL
jgi:hypothetical protein